MAHDAKRFTIIRCPKCHSNNYTVRFSVINSHGCNVKDGWVEEFPFSEIKISHKYEFKCKECGHEWNSDSFFTDIFKPE